MERMVGSKGIDGDLREKVDFICKITMRDYNNRSGGSDCFGK